jgi:hypothetical protein
MRPQAGVHRLDELEALRAARAGRLDRQRPPQPEPGAVAGLIALVVYYKLGLALLRRAWFNLDWLWALALVGAGLFAALA